MVNYWILTGSLKNWDRGISDTVWGCKPELKERWNKLQVGDVLFFYVSSPISGIVGLGKVTKKFEASSPLWPDEIIENKIIYPYRFEFKIDYVLPKSEWKEKGIKIKDLNIPFRAGINLFTNEEVIKTLLDRINSSFNTSFNLKIEEKPKLEKPANLHDEMKNVLLEIGKIDGFISEKEYPINGERLDVVWRKANISGAMPHNVFEVQIGGNVYNALGKLKHSHEKWNSNIFIIVDEKDKDKVNKLLNGTFHEIKNKLKIWTVEKVKELYELRLKEKKLNEELGLE